MRLSGVKQVSECETESRLLQGELATLKFPDGWIVEVACTDIAWQQALRRAGGAPTKTGFTQLHNRVTVLNGAIFKGFRSAYRRTIAHELGHIVCQCSGEYDADALAAKLEKTADSD